MHLRTRMADTAKNAVPRILAGEWTIGLQARFFFFFYTIISIQMAILRINSDRDCVVVDADTR